MIDGVKVKKLIVHKDIPDMEKSGMKSGFLMEVLRDDDELLSKFGQTTLTIAYKNTIKAFHWHRHQDDLWFVATGKAAVVLYDLRENSPTFQMTQVVFSGNDDYKLILIPEKVAHGYKVLSDEPVYLFYHTTQSYNSTNPDEERIPWNDSTINFNWDAVK